MHTRHSRSPAGDGKGRTGQHLSATVAGWAGARCGGGGDGRRCASQAGAVRRHVVLGAGALFPTLPHPPRGCAVRRGRDDRLLAHTMPVPIPSSAGRQQSGGERQWATGSGPVASPSAARSRPAVAFLAAGGRTMTGESARQQCLMSVVPGWPPHCRPQWTHLKLTCCADASHQAAANMRCTPSRTAEHGANRRTCSSTPWRRRRPRHQVERGSRSCLQSRRGTREALQMEARGWTPVFQ